MTFYNVVSALLFLGALRVLFRGIEALDWPQIYASGCLAVIVFNDMLSTSHLVESKAEVHYTMPLMLIDLLNFLLLALAMIVISPTANMFDENLSRLAGQLSTQSYWALLFLYWVFLMIWTGVADNRPGSHSPVLIGAQASVALAFLVEWIIEIVRPASATPRFVVLAYLILYLVIVRPLARRHVGLPD